MILTKIIPTLLVFIGLTNYTPAHAASADEQQALKQEAISIIKQFGGTLKPTLQKALQEDGPLHAIEVCAKEAPLLAKQLSEKTGWSVKRVSLKARNHNNATPDAWERGILQTFDQQQAAGEKMWAMTASKVEDGQFRFMKAQAVKPVCLLCHGADVDSDIKAALKKHYPQDQAFDYSLGQIRGAFSLSKSLDTD